MSWLAVTREKLARWIEPARSPKRRSTVAGSTFAAAGTGRLLSDWLAPSSSADSALYSSLRMLRNRSRQLIRDNGYAKRARNVVVKNVVGPKGIRLQGQVMMRRGGKLDAQTNNAIEEAWETWCRADTCHTAGRLSMVEICKLIMRAVFSDGEILIRKVRQPFGNGKTPFALEVIEIDQLVDQFSGRADNGNEVRMGVEVDKWQRRVAYWLYPRHPSDFMFQAMETSNHYIRVPADEIIHLGIADRPGQTRYLPWLSSAMVKLNHMGGFEEAEIVAARASAAVVGFIQSPEAGDMDAAGDGGAAMNDGKEDGERVLDFEPGTMRELGPGETFSGFAPTRQNGTLEPFMRFMLRSIAAALDISYEALSRDYSQSNYSSSRLALLDDKDVWRSLQHWLVEHFLCPVFEEWLDLAVVSGVLNLASYELAPAIYQKVRWHARGWDWVDPLKEVMARKQSVRAGFETLSEVIADRGGDFEDVMQQRRREIDKAAELDLVLETDPAQVNDKGDVQAMSAIAESDTGEDAAGDPKNGGEDPQQEDALANAGDGAKAAKLARTAILKARLRKRQENYLHLALAVEEQIEALEALETA